MVLRNREILCLGCGWPRTLKSAEPYHDDTGCAACGYVGWAASEDLSSAERRELRLRIQGSLFVAAQRLQAAEIAAAR